MYKIFLLGFATGNFVNLLLDIHDNYIPKNNLFIKSDTVSNFADQSFEQSLGNFAIEHQDFMEFPDLEELSTENDNGIVYV